MYEALEHYKVYKQEKDLQTKIAKEFKLPVSNNSSKLTPLEYGWLLDELCTKEMSAKEFDKWMLNLIKRNGTTEY